MLSYLEEGKRVLKGTPCNAIRYEATLLKWILAKTMSAPVLARQLVADLGTKPNLYRFIHPTPSSLLIIVFIEKLPFLHYCHAVYDITLRE